MRILITVSFFFGVFLLASAQNNEIKIWQKVPNEIVSSTYKETIIYNAKKSPRITHVTDPTLTVFQAPLDKATGSAVIICPGGGYARLSIDHEGTEVAQWFNTLGVTAFVLKYRLPHDSIMVDKSIGPLQDAQEAIRLIRRQGAKWNVNPAKVGIIGFSAGGHVASTLSTHFNDNVYPVSDSSIARPDFVILLYPVISMQSDITHPGSRTNLLGTNPSQELVDRFSNELHVTAQTPPTFLVHAGNDKTVPLVNSINYYLALNNAGVSAEMHIYEKGAHGFGLATNRESTEATWPEALIAWLKLRGLIK